MLHSIDTIYFNPIVLTSGEIPQVTVVEVTVASELKLPNKVPGEKVPICFPLNFGRITRLGITKFATRMWLTIMHHPVQKSFEKS